jgi:hypothetical protein
MTDYTRYERTQRYEQRLLSEGFRRIGAWAPSAYIDALRLAYPGPRGGIDWTRVFKAALEKAGANQ